MRGDADDQPAYKKRDAALDLKEIRELAGKFNPEQIETCIQQQIEAGVNVCLKDENTEAIVGELAKAGFVRDLMDQGMSLTDALRELARRMRQITRMKEGEGQ